ncbi:MAG: permease [Ignavibacteriales bacterium]|nr:permease [Ignavibacteriales bacterium]
MFYELLTVYEKTKQSGWSCCSLPIWILIYFNLQPVTDWLINSVFHLEKGKHLTEALRFFIFELPESIAVTHFDHFFCWNHPFLVFSRKNQKDPGRKINLHGKRVGLNAWHCHTFCSCSAIPLFLGFVESGVPLGVTFSFLIAAPMINEVAVILLFGMFGWKVAVIYIVTGLTIAIVAGWVIGKLKLEHWVQDWVYQTKMGNTGEGEEKQSLSRPHAFGFEAVKEIVGKVWIYVAIGIAVGAGAHGYVPQDFMAALMGKSAWYSVPLSVLIGVPLYSNAAGIVPIVSVLIEKGASLGTSLAFMMAVIGLSLPEMIILKKVFEAPVDIGIYRHSIYGDFNCWLFVQLYFLNIPEACLRSCLFSSDCFNAYS